MVKVAPEESVKVCVPSCRNVTPALLASEQESEEIKAKALSTSAAFPPSAR